MKEAQPENTEVAPKFNGRTKNQEELVYLDESQTTMSKHPLEGTVEVILGWP